MHSWSRRAWILDTRPRHHKQLRQYLLRNRGHSACNSRSVCFKVDLLQQHTISQLETVTQKVDSSWQDQDDSSNRGWTDLNEDVDLVRKGSVFANLGNLLQKKGSALMQILRVQARTWRQQSLPDTQQSTQQQCLQLCCWYLPVIGLNPCIALPPTLLGTTEALNFHCCNETYMFLLPGRLPWEIILLPSLTQLILGILQFLIAYFEAVKLGVNMQELN